MISPATVSDTSRPQRIGEVIGTSITAFEAQTVRLHDAPPLGSLTSVDLDDELRIYGIVASASTEGVSPGSKPVPRAHEGTENAAIYREHPDLEHVLRTFFACVVVGYQRSSHIRHFLPPHPAPIHYSVRLCDPGEIGRFTADLSYLQMILAAGDIPAEEVLAAHIRCAAESRRDSYAFSVRAGREVAGLLRDDFQRVSTILQRIRPEQDG